MASPRDTFSPLEQMLKSTWDNVWEDGYSNRIKPALKTIADDLDEFSRRQLQPRHTTDDASTSLVENGECYTLRVAMPGISTKNVNIRVHGKTVIVEGSDKQEQQEDAAGKSYHWDSIARNYRAQFLLREDVDIDAANAKAHNGIITVVIPKTSRPEGKTIRVIEE